MEFHLEFGEHITASVRKHWFVFVLELIPFALLAILPSAFPYVLDAFRNLTAVYSEGSAVAALTQFNMDSPWLRFLHGMWLLLIWCGAFNTFTRYYLNMWIITSTRIVYIHQYGFFSREVSSFLLNHVQDVTTEVYGLFATVLGYGRLNVETAGDSSKTFHMDGIPDPTRYRDLIMKEIANLHKVPGKFHL
ncbi:PH domain-containing protein [Patescibacteria group bacterium]|nr:PH domain-containing protein [Patescibacteria group bacterium]MBU1754756.1 PH domain-containing protein [Patescibacteria group bacterium]